MEEKVPDEILIKLFSSSDTALKSFRPLNAPLSKLLYGKYWRKKDP
jgi:hypothetical protein